MQSQIYQELDKGTDNDARTKLQTELPEMRAVLKRLREGSRSEFACFKKMRRSKSDRGERGERGERGDRQASAANSVVSGGGNQI